MESDCAQFEGAPAQMMRDLSDRLGAVGGDGRPERRQMNWDVRQKEASDFFVDIGLARRARSRVISSVLMEGRRHRCSK
jgi:hypothetical protein